MVQTRQQAKRARLDGDSATASASASASTSAKPHQSSSPEPGSSPGVAAASLRQAFLVERLLCEADAAEVAMSGVKMIQDNTKTCLNNLERSLLRCKAFLQHRCIPKECAEATSAMLDEFRRELDALRQREDRILKLCSRQQATVTLKNREFTEAVVHLIQQCL